MWIRINRETKIVEGYINVGKPCKKKGTELIKVDDIPDNWQYCKYENNQFILDEAYKQNKIEKEELNNIRIQREIECFPYINRGNLWYSKLTEEQSQELDAWYQEWLDAPDTRKLPSRPTWLK